ncbi:MAG: RNA 2',3'-cyclic phosphodiesterase [Actinomycetota bacterium]|nr:RNA 2',3'-cyclic phosphodiesterase [Actinomycetota bacterium]
MPKRLFVAIRPPRTVLEELAGAVEPLHTELPAPRWTRIESWHLTLAFLGAVDEPGPLMEQLEQVAERHRPIRLHIGGAGHFDNRVLWAGVSGDHASLRRLAESVRAAARQTGLKVEGKPYRGHITLARGVGDVDMRVLADRLRGFTGSVWTATSLYLIESRLGAGPARSAQHQIYQRWPLRP